MIKAVVTGCEPELATAMKAVLEYQLGAGSIGIENWWRQTGSSPFAELQTPPAVVVGNLAVMEQCGHLGFASDPELAVQQIVAESQSRFGEHARVIMICDQEENKEGEAFGVPIFPLGGSLNYRNLGALISRWWEEQGESVSGELCLPKRS